MSDTEYPDGQPPTIVEDLQDVKVSFGGIARLQIVVDAAPEPQVEWYKDNMKISGKQYEVFIEDYAYVLEIYDCRYTDTGDYKCVITNDVGKISSVSYVEVIRPGKIFLKAA